MAWSLTKYRCYFALSARPLYTGGTPSWHTRKKNRYVRRCHPSTCKKGPPSQAVLSRMQLRFLLTLLQRESPKHLSALRAWCEQMSTCCAETRRAPSRLRRDPRVSLCDYTGMHYLSKPQTFNACLVFENPTCSVSAL